MRRELAGRLGYLERVGLSYLTLDRPARTLSGGEAQRVSLTAALGTSLTGALFVLDEPTVGLHPADVGPLTGAMAELATRGNIALVIEHDPLVIRSAHRVLELGPGAGKHGGTLCFDGTPQTLARRADLPTGRLLSASGEVKHTPRARTGEITVREARAHNLQGVSVKVPLGVLCAITGPSGSGKSTLMDEVLYRHLARALGEKDAEQPGEAAGVEGLEAVQSVTFVDQSPLGRTSRGNAATYTKAWDRLRERFASEPEAEVRGLTSAHFSFNVDKGRCEACSGEGYETVEMQFLADVSLLCPVCRGRRFKEEVLAIRHQGMSVADVLEATVDEVLARFGDDKALARTLGPVSRLGLGYLTLGQPLSTFSGGEAQRLKLARALASEPENSLFLIDEPSAGLHDADVRQVLAALHELVEAGASVIVVDHDLVVMRGADWIIDLGPGGGRNGGRLVAEGTPEQVARGEGLTAAALRGELPPVVVPQRKGKGAVDVPAAIEVDHAREHNLQDVSCRIPLGKMTVVTGPCFSTRTLMGRPPLKSSRAAAAPRPTCGPDPRVDPTRAARPPPSRPARPGPSAARRPPAPGPCHSRAPSPSSESPPARPPRAGAWPCTRTRAPAPRCSPESPDRTPCAAAPRPAPGRTPRPRPGARARRAWRSGRGSRRRARRRPSRRCA